jgi:hypothetical protein
MSFVNERTWKTGKMECDTESNENYKFQKVCQREENLTFNIFSGLKVQGSLLLDEFQDALSVPCRDVWTGSDRDSN